MQNQSLQTLNPEPIPCGCNWGYFVEKVWWWKFGGGEFTGEHRHRHGWQFSRQQAHNVHCGCCVCSTTPAPACAPAFSSSLKTPQLMSCSVKSWAVFLLHSEMVISPLFDWKPPRYTSPGYQIFRFFMLSRLAMAFTGGSSLCDGCRWSLSLWRKSRVQTHGRISVKEH